MKIRVKSDGVKLFIPVPLWLGGPAIRIGCRVARKKHIRGITKEEQKAILTIYKVIKKEAKKHKGLKIVEVSSSDGNEVTITL